MKKTLRLIFSSILGMAVFAFFYSFVEAGILLSMIFGVSSLLGSFLLLSPEEIDQRLEEMARLHGIKPEILKKIIKNGRKKLRKMKKLAMSIEDESVRQKIMEIHEVTQRIFEDFKKDPKDIKAAKQFLNYYLDTTVKIIRQYSELLGEKPASERNATLKRVEGTLDMIKDAFSKQLDKLYEDDFLHLDSELKVLEKSIKMEGL